MAPQIVLSCRMSSGGIGPGRPRGYLERARALTQRAEAHGATLAAWSAATLSFAWDTASAEEAVAFAASLRDDASDATDAWACGMAQGEMEPLSPQGQRADLAWGPPLVAAVALARIAHPGEVLLDASVEPLRSGELLRLGGRSGKDGGKLIRGARLDLRLPWKRDAAAKVASLVEPDFIGRSGVVESLLGTPGVVAVVRAAPGVGGSRLLAEIARKAAPASSLLVAPSGLGVEPLGALRRAFARSRGELPVPRALESTRARLLAGEGVTLDAAAALVGATLAQGSRERPAALLIDDAAQVDGVTLEACAAAITHASLPLLAVVRLDEGDPLHPSLAAAPQGLEVEVKPLGASEAALFARACTGGALDAEASERWSRRGACSPLAIMEALACSLATGELAWVGDAAFARKRLVGKGRPRPAMFWLLRRAEELSAEARAVLSALALLGGDSSRETLDRVLAAVGAKVDTRAALGELVVSRWVRELPPEGGESGSVELLTRSHRDAVLEFTAEGRVRAWHRAVALSLSDTGPLARAEAAYHASKAGDGPLAARLALEAAAAAAEVRLEGSALRLTAFADTEDPSSQGSIPVPVPVSITEGPSPANEVRDSEPPTIATVGERGAPPSDVAPHVDMPGPGPIGSFAEALAVPAVSPSVAPPSSEHELLAERMRAIAELSHGQVAHAVLVLRQAHAKLADGAASQSALCQASLVLAVALAHAGQEEEAMLQGLDALARAREAKDKPGEQACVTFLAKIFEGTSQAPLAQKLRAKVAAG